MSRCYGAAIRNEDWFKLIDTSNSGEITVRKLIVAMMRYQDIRDLNSWPQRIP